MKTSERENTSDAGNMIQTLCVLSVGILLTNYTTGDFSWQSTVLMVAVILAAFVSNAFVVAQTKRH
jgi:type IV secretory pathway VirB2 component (pilin)